MTRYLKAIVAILGAVLTAVLTQFPDSELVQQWGPIVSALLTAAGVYLVPNDPAPTEDRGAVDLGTVLVLCVLVLLVLILVGVLPVR